MRWRNPHLVAGLTVLTFGLYGLFWLVRTRGELAYERGRIPTSLWLLAPLAGYLLLLGTGSSWPSLGLLLALLLLLVVLVGLLTPVWWLYAYLMAAEKVTHNQVNGLGTFIIFMGLIIAEMMTLFLAIMLAAESSSAFDAAAPPGWIWNLIWLLFFAGLFFYLQSHYNGLVDRG